jgi:hypothetical protein
LNTTLSTHEWPGSSAGSGGQPVNLKRPCASCEKPTFRLIADPVVSVKVSCCGGLEVMGCWGANIRLVGVTGLLAGITGLLGVTGVLFGAIELLDVTGLLVDVTGLLVEVAELLVGVTGLLVGVTGVVVDVTGLARRRAPRRARGSEEL